jgi:L-ascorbate metabolism protein UlaG (beta-lactamase superfamily)
MPRYTNLDGSTPDKTLGDLFRWQVTDRLAGRRRIQDPGFTPPSRPNDGAALAEERPHATWIGHATFLLRLGKKLIATDPIWSPDIHGIKRLGAPGVPLERVPPIDVVTVSHAHYDHLDLPTLRAIGPRALYIVPKDVGPILKRAGLPRVVELGWWETHAVGELSVTLVPAQHWSMRTPFDRNKRLWGGFVYESREGVAYHAGDTAFHEQVFETIGKRAPRIDWAMLPIGAYEPQWMMKPQHMGPEEAVRAWETLGAAQLFAMHWGTFRLTDEPMAEPPARLASEWARRTHDPSRVRVFDIGETRPLL